MVSIEEQDRQRRLNARREAWMMKRIKDLIELGRTTFYTEEHRAKVPESQILGCLVAHYFRWTGKPIIETIQSALEDANLATLNKQFSDLITQR